MNGSLVLHYELKKKVTLTVSLVIIITWYGNNVHVYTYNSFYLYYIAYSNVYDIITSLTIYTDSFATAF